MSNLNSKTAIAAMITSAVLSVGTMANAATFTDQTAFGAAVSDTATETFDNDIATDVSITFDNGTTATKSSPGVPQTLNRVLRGVYTGFVQRDGFRDITFDFGSQVFGFGGDFSSGLYNSSLMVSGLFDGVQSMVSIADAIGNAGFFGLTSTTPFQTITFRTNAGAFLFGGATPFGGETFNVDNLTQANDLAAPAPVPLPAAGLLLLAAFGMLAGLKRRRNAAA